MAKQSHSYNSGRINRAEAANRPSRQAAAPPPPPAKKKRRRWPWVVLLVFVLVISVLGMGAGYLYDYLKSDVLEPGATGVIASEHKTADEFNKDVFNLLVVGIDNEENRGYADGLGQTDLILYINYDLKNNKMNILQIPRDTYVGVNYESQAGGAGKINALLLNGSDQENPINNLASYIATQYKLPVDGYVSVDMDAMREIVDIFGGIYVYVPREMSHDGSYLAQGWQWMDGNAAEFFVRNRYGEGFERADIDRLDNQRHFYSAIFRRFMNMTARDVARLVPVFEYRCNTDITLSDMIGIATKALNLQSSDVLFCKAPGATSSATWASDPTGAGRSVYVIDLYGRGTEEEPGLAGLLNQYFRTYGEPVPPEDMGPQISIPIDVTLYATNIQVIGDVMEGEGGEDIDVEPDFG